MASDSGVECIMILPASAFPMMGQVASAFDPDAQAFITATGITDSTQQSAINTLTISLKSANVWTKLDAIYPFVGGTAFTHQFNLKDPRNLDAAFRLSYVGTVSHSSTGITHQAGTISYSNTFYNPVSVSRGQNDQSQGVYVRPNVAGESDLGMLASGGNVALYSRFNDGNTYFRNNDLSGSAGGGADSTGFFIGNRASSLESRNRRRGTLLVVTTTSSANFNSSIIFGTLSNIANGAGREYAFAFVGKALTDTETLDFHNAVQTYQTTLGRAV